MAKPWDQRADESAQAYSAFTIYLKLKPTERTLDKAYQHHWERKHGQPAGKLKKSPGQWTKWSQRYEWPARAMAFDADQQRKILIRAANRRQKEIEQFVQLDMMISLGVQRITSRKVAAMMKQEPVEVDGSELRQVTMSYDHARQWLTELIGLFDSETSPFTELTMGDEALAQRLADDT